MSNDVDLPKLRDWFTEDKWCKRNYALDANGGYATSIASKVILSNAVQVCLVGAIALRYNRGRTEDVINTEEMKRVMELVHSPVCFNDDPTTKFSDVMDVLIKADI